MAGLTIVFMAIVLDRISHGFSQIDTSHSAKQATGFHLFPNKLDRYAIVRGFEKGIDWILTGCYRLSQMLARGLAKLASLIMRLFGKKDGDDSLPTFFENHAFLIGSIFLLVVLVGTNAFVFAFGQEFPESWKLEFNQPVDAAIAWMRDNLYQIGDLPIGTGPLTSTNGQDDQT